MALFSSGKNDKITKVRPTVLRTQNVARELLQVAHSNNVKVEELDFKLLETKTYTRLKDESIPDMEWTEMSQEDLYEMDDATALLNPNFEIKQVHEIEIFSKNDDENLYKDFKLTVGANATKCKVYLTISAGSEVQYSQTFERELLVIINKRKIRAGILINVFDEMLPDVISKISAFVRVSKKAIYQKKETLLIAESYEPKLTINDALILHFENKKEAVVDENKKMDYSSRGFIKNVKKGELLIEYRKAKVGKAGRSCRGTFIKPAEPIIRHEPSFKINETIKEIETYDNIQYIAVINGYISFDDNQYSIKNDVDLSQISFKTTGSISTGLDSDVSVSVKEEDVEKDAIGTGMIVEVSEIDIEGSVGPNAKVFALKADIAGQTHKTSIVRANELNINIHRGNAYGKKVHIARLEHGNIDCDRVSVEQAIGGTIRAKEIQIGLCGSHVRATASKLIEIKKLQGSENFFTIDPLLKKSAREGLHTNDDDTKEIEIEIKHLADEVNRYTKLIKDGMNSFNDIKKRLLHYKKNGIKMPDSFIKKYKQFQKMQTHLVELKKEQTAKTKEYSLLTTNRSSFQDDILDARIINRSRWVGHNELKFKLVDPPMDILYYPSDGSYDQVFALVQDIDGNYEVKVIKE